MPAARASPPMRPRATAAAFLPSSVVMSSISPVAILAIMMALPMASAGRFSPLGPLGICPRWRQGPPKFYRPNLSIAASINPDSNVARFDEIDYDHGAAVQVLNPVFVGHFLA